MMNSLTIQYPWCSTTSSEVEYKYTNQPSKNTFMKLMINEHTLSTTLGQPQHVLQTNLKE